MEKQERKSVREATQNTKTHLEEPPNALMSHRRTVQSEPPEANTPLSVLKEREKTVPSCPYGAPSFFPLAKSHTITALSSPVVKEQERGRQSGKTGEREGELVCVCSLSA